MLISNLNKDIKNKINKKDLYYLKFIQWWFIFFAGPVDCERNNPFTNSFSDSHKEDWNKIRETLIDISYVNDVLSYLLMKMNLISLKHLILL